MNKLNFLYLVFYSIYSLLLAHYHSLNTSFSFNFNNGVKVTYKYENVRKEMQIISLKSCINKTNQDDS